METNSLSEQIKKLRRSPKIGQIYELYRAEMEPVLRSSTMTKLDKVWYAHLSALSDLRAGAQGAMKCRISCFSGNNVTYKPQQQTDKDRCKD